MDVLATTRRNIGMDKKFNDLIRSSERISKLHGELPVIRIWHRSKICRVVVRARSGVNVARSRFS
jgi:hypothetical protein